MRNTILEIGNLNFNWHIDYRYLSTRPIGRYGICYLPRFRWGSILHICKLLLCKKLYVRVYYIILRV